MLRRRDHRLFLQLRSIASTRKNYECVAQLSWFECHSIAKLWFQAALHRFDLPAVQLYAGNP
jgi:hypothetical protein